MSYVKGMIGWGFAVQGYILRCGADASDWVSRKLLK